MNRPLRLATVALFLLAACAGGNSGSTATASGTTLPAFTTGPGASGSSASNSGPSSGGTRSSGNSTTLSPSTTGTPTGVVSGASAGSGQTQASSAVGTNSTGQTNSTGLSNSTGLTNSTGQTNNTGATNSTGTVTTAGSTGGGSTTGTPAIVALAVTPPNATVAVGGFQQFRAVATLSDGTNQDVSLRAIWTSSPSSTASVDNTGKATALEAGSATITATLNNLSGAGTLIISSFGNVGARATGGSTGLVTITTATAASTTSALTGGQSTGGRSAGKTSGAVNTGGVSTGGRTTTAARSSAGGITGGGSTARSSSARSTARSTGKATTATTTATATTTTTGGTGYCPPPAFDVSNGDVGVACTGAPTDGGVAQGSCASGEFCLEYLETGKTQCTQLCSATTACPGSGYCYPFNADAGIDLCIATCLPDGAACPDGDVCSGETPNPGDWGLCVPPCTGSSSCNSSSATAFACSDGLCKCTNSATDCPSGWTCDASSGICYMGCDLNSTPCPSGYGCCGQSGNVDYCDWTQAGTTSSTTGTVSTTGTTGTATASTTTIGTTTGTLGTSTTGTTGSGFCPPPTLTVTNGDIGKACTGAPTDGGIAQGSCATGEYCLEYLETGKTQCTQLCDTTACPGNAYCYPFNTDAGVNLCVAACVPDQGGCPDGDVCAGDTPSPGDQGLCVPPCTDNAYCNSSVGTNFVCSGKLCKCSNTATDCPSGYTCDPVSGSCYYGCDPTSSPCPSGFGCCAQQGTVDFCDYTQAGTASSTTTGTTGTATATATTTGSGTTTSGVSTTTSTTSTSTTSSTTGTTGVGPHAAWPQVPDNGGDAVVASPKIVTVTYAADTNQAAIQSWAGWAATSSWLATVGADYGVGTGSNTNVPLPKATKPPTTIDDTPSFSQTSCTTNAQCPSGDSCYPEYQLCVTPSALQKNLDSMITKGTVPALDPNGNTVYMLYYPSTTTITSGSEQSCSSFYGYHYAYHRPSNGALVVYAVLPDCTAISPYTDAQTVNYAASHELIEASTDPNPYNPRWTLETSANYDNPWWYTFGEVGDMCVENFYQDPTTGNIAQRIWSNSAATGDGSPCLPVPAGVTAFIGNSVGNQTISTALGGTATIDAQAWATGPTGGAWNQTLFLAGGSANVTNDPSLVTISSPSVASVSNGVGSTFTVNMSSSLAECDYAYMWLWITAYPDSTDDTTWWPVVVSIGDLSSCSGAAPLRTGGHRIPGPHLFRTMPTPLGAGTPR